MTIDTSRFQLPSLPAAIRPLSTADSRTLITRYGAAVQTSPAGCETCSGTKVFRWYAPHSRDPQTIAEYDCNCEDQFVLHRVLMNAGIKNRYQRLDWEDTEGVSPRSLSPVVEYIESSQGMVRSGIGMVFHGEPGTGKTLLSNLLLKSLVAKGIDCYATTFADMIETFTSGWRDKDEKAWFNRRVRDAEVLYIDDLGRERNKGLGSVGESMLEEVVRNRVAQQEPTFLSTNIDVSDLAGAYGGHTFSLLRESAIMVDFTGENWHLARSKARNLHEVKVLGLSRPVMAEIV